MIDITAISAALSSLKTATDIAKILRESDLSFEKAEIKMKLAELMSSLADAKIELSQIQEILIERDKKIRDLEEALTIRANLKFDGAVYWQESTGQEKEGPYCPRCYDVDNKLVRLHTTSKPDIWHCLGCDKFIQY